MSHIFTNKDGDLVPSPIACLRTPQEERNLLGESLTNLTWLRHLNVGTIIPPCGKYDDIEDSKRSTKMSVLNLPTPRQTSHYSQNRSLKPPYSYVILIGLAFRYLKCDRLSSEQISKHIIKEFPYFESTSIQTHIRDTLQHNKLFERVRKRKDEAYSGIFWRISDNVLVKSDSDLDDDSGIGFVDKKKRSSSLFSTEDYLLDDGDNGKNKKIRTKSAEFPVNDDHFDYNFPGDDFMSEFNWDSLLSDSKQADKPCEKYSDDWFPAYEGRGCDSIYGHENSSLRDFNGTSPGFDESKNLYDPNPFMGGYCETGDLLDFTSAIHFDPLMSTSWDAQEYGSLSRNQGHRFGREGM